ncbi:MAG: peptidase M29 [Lautropia sp.]
MLVGPIEERWIAAFCRTLAGCALRADERCVVLSQTRSRPDLVRLAEVALLRMGAKPFQLRLLGPGARDRDDAWLEPAIDALATADFVLDLSPHGLMHASALPRILATGTRVLSIGNEHPDTLERLAPDPAQVALLRVVRQRVESSRRLQVTSRAGTQLLVSTAGSRCIASSGFADEPGVHASWPAGTCQVFAVPHAVNGIVSLSVGDANLAFNRYVESRLRLLVQNDVVTDIKGDGVDARLLRHRLVPAAHGGASAAFDPQSRRDHLVSHLGFGLNPAARWEAMTLYDRRDFGGAELRACQATLHLSIGVADDSGRPATDPIDLVLADCTVALDAEVIIDEGRLAAGVVGDAARIGHNPVTPSTGAHS